MVASLVATVNSASDRIDLSLSGWTFSAPTISRVVYSTNTPTPIRGAQPATVSGQAWSGYDAEAPHNTDLYYMASAGLNQVTSAVVNLYGAREIRLKHLTNAALSTLISIVEVPSFSRPSKSTFFEPIGRKNPIASSSTKRGSLRGSMILRTQTQAEWQALDAIFADDSVLLLQSPPDYYFGGDVYIQPGDIDESPLITRVVGYDNRRWSVPFTVVSAPAGVENLSTYSWNQLAIDYVSWNDLATQRPGYPVPTWDNIMYGPKIQPQGPS
jgi:hypothetical protein